MIYFLALILLPFESTATIYEAGSQISNKQAFQIPGLYMWDTLGYQIANAGDFNKDGYDDIIIGAPGGSHGSIYVIYGKAGSSFPNINLDSLSPAAGFKITGGSSGGDFGNSVGGAGDVNGDGFADIVIGSSGLNYNKGAVYVIYGKANFTSIDFRSESFSPSMGFMITGNSQGDYLGYAVAGAGDVNNDGLDDIIIGAPNVNSKKGAAYVIYGKQTGTNINPVSTLDPATTGIIIKGNANSDLFGDCVSMAGDINKDGYDDIIIGAPNKLSKRGAVYVIYGRASPIHIDLATALLPASTGFMITGKTASETFGFSVGSAGDINKDGYDDMIIGAEARNYDRGAVQVIYGGPTSGFSNIDLSTTTLDPKIKGFTITGNSGGDSLGYSVAPAGDINKDGYADIIIGAPNKYSNRGAIYVVYGGETQTRVNIELATKELQPLVDGFAISGKQAGGQFGISVAAVDLNNDGSMELLVGAPYGSLSYGMAYVIFPSKICGANCASCSKIETCDTCQSPFGVENSICVICSLGKYPDNGGPCTTCPTGCTRCTSATSCQACSTEFYKPAGSNTVCTRTTCSDGCIDCTTISSCTTCAVGYIKSSSATCISCPGGCGVCSSSSACSTCLTGYFPVGGQCCPDECSACTDFETCTACKTGYGLESGKCVTCDPGTFPSNTGCQNCPNPCSECTSASSCTACDSGYGLWSSQCMSSCPDETYLDLNGNCEGCLSACRTCTDGSTCASCKTGKVLHLSQCIDPCPDKTFPSLSGFNCEDCPEKCSKCSPSTCTACEAGYTLSQSQCILECADATYLDQINSKCEACPMGCSKCTSNSACQQCHQGYILSDSNLCDVNLQEKPIKQSEKAASGAFDGTSTAGAALTSGSSMPINFGLVAKILRNLKYLNVTVSVELQETFHSWKVNGGFLKAPKSWSQESSSKPLPGVFRRYGLDPVFLINYWKPLIMTLIGIFLFFAFKIMEIGLNKSGKQDPMKTSIPRKLNVVASNFVLTQIYSTLDDVFFYFILDARSTEFDGAFRSFSFGLALVFILLGSVMLGFHGILLRKYQNLKRDKTQTNNFLYKHENMKLIFEDFKDTTLIIQSFLWILLARSIISSLLIATLFEYPLVQTVILLISNSGMIIFISVKTPFKDILATCSQLFGEIILLLANICIFIMAIIDKQDSSDRPVNTIKHLSKCVIVLNAILLFGSAILMIVGILRMLWNAYQARKKPRLAIPAQIKNNRMEEIHTVEKLNITTQINQSENWQHTSPQEEYEYTSGNDGFEPRQNYSSSPGYDDQMTLHNLDLTTNAQNQFEISSNMNGQNPNNFYFNNVSSNYQEPYQLGTNASFIDETMMNTSNANLIRHNSLRPRIRGKIKMPGGIEINPRSNNSANPGLEFHNPLSLPYQNPKPTNMENSNVAGFGSEIEISEAQSYQKRITNQHEEAILKRTRARLKHYHPRRINSYK